MVKQKGRQNVSAYCKKTSLVRFPRKVPHVIGEDLKRNVRNIVSWWNSCICAETEQTLDARGSTFILPGNFWVPCLRKQIHAKIPKSRLIKRLYEAWIYVNCFVGPSANEMVLVFLLHASYLEIHVGPLVRPYVRGFCRVAVATYKRNLPYQMVLMVTASVSLAVHTST